MHKWFLSAALLLLAVSASAADDLKSEIQGLRQEIAALRLGAIQSNTGAADAASAVGELQTQMEALKTAIEANSHAIEMQNETIGLRLNEFDARVGALEEKLSIQGKQVTSAVSAVAPEAAAEAELYQFGLNQINGSEFLKAIATFKKFMTKFPKSEYVASAQYWIGECYFAMKDYEQAIKEFQVVKEKYPRSDKVPAALLKQGYAFFELDMESDAVLFLNSLIRQYPQTKETAEAKVRIERMRKAKEAAKHAPQKGGVPLAPGVVVPEKTAKERKNAEEKYK